MPITLPLPCSLHTGAPLRTLTNQTLRVSGLTESLTRAAALIERALGVTLQPDDSDPDVILRRESVPAPTPHGTDPRPADRAGASEAYEVRTVDGHLVVRSGSDEGFFRALVSVASLVTLDVLPEAEIRDYPRYSWRGLSLDVVRRWFSVDEVERIIDLLALHKFNVLHLHLNDVEAWRFTVPGYPTLTPEQEFFTAADLDHLVEYARDRFVTLVPEVDFPGHVAETVQALPGFETRVGVVPLLTYLDWSDPGVAPFARAVLSEVATRFDSPYVHIGGDEVFGSPREVYAEFIRECLAELHGLGRRGITWQEAVRAGAHGPTDLVQLWVGDRDQIDPEKLRAAAPAELRPLVDKAEADGLLTASTHDHRLIGTAGIGTIVSSSDPLYLDRTPSEGSSDPEQQRAFDERLGNKGYVPTPSWSIIDWEPESQADIVAGRIRVSGIEAALWCETVENFDDAAQLLLPRLGFVAQRAWQREEAVPEEIIRATQHSSRAWERLGFTGFHRSVDVFPHAAPARVDS